MDIRSLIQEQARRYSNKPAIIFKDTRITFQALQSHVLKLGGVLAQMGIAKTDKVAVYLPNCPEYAYSYLSCFCIGAVCVPLDYMLTREELISCLTHSETKILIAKPRKDIDLYDIQSAVPSLQKIITISDTPEDASLDQNDYHLLMAQASGNCPPGDITESDPALIMYTSGTTGRPKGILLNQKHLEGSPRAMEYFVDLTDKDVKLAAIPLSHIGGFIYIQNCLIFGITLVLMERFNPYEFLKDVAQYQVTCFHIVPAMYTALLSLKQIDKFDLSSLRWVVVFGAPSSPEILERFHTHCPNARLLNGWGMTETCPPNTVTPLGSKNIASVGKPSKDCQMKIVNDKDEDLAAGEIGEILISGWTVMEGYYKDPEATAAVKRNGWLYTGDLGRFDNEGFLYIVGRKKEMIKVSGQIVYAPEVEAAFYKHEMIEEVAVIGVSDKLRGEIVKAFVVLREAARISPEELRYFAKEHLANFKVPQTIEIRTSLPKNRTGKIDKALLMTETGP